MPTGDASQLSVDRSLNMLQHSAITNTAGFLPVTCRIRSRPIRPPHGRSRGLSPPR